MGSLRRGVAHDHDAGAHLDYVAAALAAGARAGTSCCARCCPTSVHLVVVATLEMALAILLEAALSFLGLGVPPPLPSWGLMIAEAKDYMFFTPWVIMIPGIALFVLVLGINLLGDGLRDLLGAGRRNEIKDRRGGPTTPPPCGRGEASGLVTTVLEVANLRVRFGNAIEAVRGVSLTVKRGETHCLVGESGCGKSVTALAVMGLLARGATATPKRCASMATTSPASPSARCRSCAATGWR